jgi:ferredoxin
MHSRVLAWMSLLAGIPLAQRGLARYCFRLKISLHESHRQRIPAKLAPAADGTWRVVTRGLLMAEESEIEVVLKRSGLTFVVPPDKSILQVLIDEGIDPLYDCQRGECGICQVVVLEGVPDHRDHILSDDERASNKMMQICVSRAKTPRLVLDL